MRFAVTADLHWGHSEGAPAAEALARRVVELAPDAFIIAGDVGTGEHFGGCLSLFAPLSCVRLVVPGNHDLWTSQPAPASLALYEQRLPRVAAEHGFHYLDLQPFLAPGGREAVVGSINWYDYSFADPSLEEEFPSARAMYEGKLFPRGRHNDGRFVRLGMTDAEFTERVVAHFREQLAALPPEVERIVVVQHHPPVRELFYPRPATTMEGRFWPAYTGNRRMQEAVLADPRVATVICGHTHAYCAAEVRGKRCRNIGGDYAWKRLLLLDTDTGEEQWWDFDGKDNGASRGKGRL
jgi:3',5'-cyclic AMP phosphodiesterase CpdA